MSIVHVQFYNVDLYIYNEQLKIQAISFSDFMFIRNMYHENFDNLIFRLEYNTRIDQEWKLRTESGHGRFQ